MYMYYHRGEPGLIIIMMMNSTCHWLFYILGLLQRGWGTLIFSLTQTGSRDWQWVLPNTSHKLIIILNSVLHVPLCGLLGMRQQLQNIFCFQFRRKWLSHSYNTQRGLIMMSHDLLHHLLNWTEHSGLHKEIENRLFLSIAGKVLEPHVSANASAI